MNFDKMFRHILIGGHWSEHFCWSKFLFFVLSYATDTECIKRASGTVRLPYKTSQWRPLITFIKAHTSQRHNQSWTWLTNIGHYIPLTPYFTLFSFPVFNNLSFLWLGYIICTDLTPFFSASFALFRFYN